MKEILKKVKEGLENKPEVKYFEHDLEFNTIKDFYDNHGSCMSNEGFARVGNMLIHDGIGLVLIVNPKDGNIVPHHIFISFSISNGLKDMNTHLVYHKRKVKLYENNLSEFYEYMSKKGE